MKNLKRCPLCGGPVAVVEIVECIDVIPMYQCKCQKCGCTAEDGKYTKVDLAIEAWNGAVEFKEACRKRFKNADNDVINGGFTSHTIKSQPVVVCSSLFPIDKEVMQIDIEDGVIVKDIIIDTKEKKVLISHT